MLQHVLKNSDETWKDSLSEEEAMELHDLDNEWDTTSVVRAGAMVLSAAGIIFGIARNKKFFGLTGIAVPYLFPSRAKKSILAKTLKYFQLTRSRKEIELDRNTIYVNAKSTQALPTEGTIIMEEAIGN